MRSEMLAFVIANGLQQGTFRNKEPQLRAQASIAYCSGVDIRLWSRRAVDLCRVSACLCPAS
jgi:hypothetical protein